MAGGDERRTKKMVSTRRRVVSCHPELTREGSAPESRGKILREYAQDDSRLWCLRSESRHGVLELLRRASGANQEHRFALAHLEVQHIAGDHLSLRTRADDGYLTLRPRILEPARAAELRADFDECDLPIPHR